MNIWYIFVCVFFFFLNQSFSNFFSLLPNFLSFYQYNIRYRYLEIIERDREFLVRPRYLLSTKISKSAVFEER